MCIGIARILLTFNLPDIKPLNCQSCLSFWSTVIVCAFFDYHIIGISLISYLLSDLILVWESKR